MSNIFLFETPAVRCFLVFGVPNAKYLAFGTLDGNALAVYIARRQFGYNAAYR